MADNFNDNQLDLISSGETTYTFNKDVGDYIQVIVSNQDGNVITLDDGSLAVFSSYNDDFQVYEDDTKDTDGNKIPNIFVKPNEILSTFNIPSGNYQLRFDFLRNYFDEDTTNEVTSENIIQVNPRFYINQISPSRKEIRLLARQNVNTNLSIDDIRSSFEAVLGLPGSSYFYNYVTRLNNGSTLPITNYVFDNSSIILRLQTPLPTDFNTLDIVSIERILIDSQEQDIYYISNVVGDGGTGGLTPFTDEYSHLINAQDTDEFQSYDELILSSSISDEQLSLISGSIENQYQNLNIDFKDFSNHVFFGSAVSKLQNFKTKVSTIENNLLEISQSLTTEQSATSSNGNEDAISPTHINDRRKVLFNKILDIKNNFTPYERFLYYDNQSNANTSSAPGLGDNLSDVIPVTQSVTYKTLNNFDGFKTVHKISGSGGEVVDLFSNLYFAKNAPFFNFSGSVYLSFLCKASGSEMFDLNLNNTNEQQTPALPSDAFTGSAILNPSATGSTYQRYIFEVSQSYFEPVGTEIDVDSDNFEEGSGDFTILQGSDITGSGKFTAGGAQYATFPNIFNPDTVESGSVLPMGELFNITYTTKTPITSSYIVDARISLKNPTNALPFSQIYSTGSTEWTSWYDGLILSASYYDDHNIHSLVNNLPRILREDAESNELKTFINMWGEHFDLLRNYVDNYASFYKRRYKKSESIPTNLLPILAENLGWELINPFTGSLSEYFTSQTFGNNHQEIANNTWRKILNNLIYIYKSKGTSNAVQALLNSYGYPSDVLTINEFGGKTEPSNPEIITSEIKTLRQGLSGRSDNVAFIQEKSEFIAMNMRGSNKIKTSWHTNNAKPDTLEFVFGTSDVSNNQTLVQSSGSGALPATASLQITSNDTSHYDGSTIIISSSDGTGKTYIFDDDNDGATGTLDGSGRVRIQINGLNNNDEIATEVSKSISSANGHLGKIQADDFVRFLTDSGEDFITSDGDTLFSNASGSIFLTQLTASSDGNLPITTTTPSMSVAGFGGGSDNQTLWDIRLLSGSNLQFRLNNSINASSSADLTPILTTPTISSSFERKDLFNVILQRDATVGISEATQSYTLGLALQDNDKIQEFSVVSASISNSVANNNFIGIGSRHVLSSSNLIFGKTLTGSMGEIRAWTGSISMSKFKQHTLNKFSVVGNTGVSSSRELIYRFRLNENYVSGTLGNVFDANPNHNGDYTIPSSSLTLTNNGNLYNSRIITVVKFGLRTGGENQQNDNKIVINPQRQMVENLHPVRQSFTSNYNVDGVNNSQPSTKLELVRSINKKVNDYIINILSDVSITDYFSNPQDLYQDKYNELDNLRDDILEGVKVDVNKFIEAQSRLLNTAVIDNITSIIPARSNLSNIGVQIDQNLLERTKIKHKEMTISTGSDAGLFDMNFGRLDNISYDFSNSSFDNEISFTDLKVNKTIQLNDSEFELDKEGLINMDEDVIILNKSEYVESKEMTLQIIDNNISFIGSDLLPIFDESKINLNDFIIGGGNFESEKTAEVKMVEVHSLSNSKFGPTHDFDINYKTIYNLSASFESGTPVLDLLMENENFYTFTSNFNNNTFESEISHLDMKDVTFNLDENNFDSNINYDEMYNLTSTFNKENFNLELNQIDVYDFANSEFITDKEGVTDNKTIIGNNKDLSLTWGTTTNDTQFLNFQESLPPNRREKGANSDYNVAHYENRFNFITIGGSTLLSSSINVGGNGFIDFENHKFILNERIHSDGRTIGATHKISSSANGVITYPENHFKNLGTSKLSIRHPFYIGSKNGVTLRDENNKTFYSSKVQFKHGLDLQPTASFYTINVGGADTDTILRVEKPGSRTKT